MSRIFEALTEASKQRPGSHPEVQCEPHLPEPAVAEYRFLRERIVRLTANLNQRALLFASPSIDRGSLPIVTNFCLTLSGAGETVLLVGMNMDDSFMRRVFGISGAPDMAELFSRGPTIQEFMHKTIYRNLSLLSGDILLTNPLSYEERNLLRATVDEMKSAVDWIVFGCPTLTHIETAATLAGIVDGAILIVEADKTLRQSARRTQEHLEKAGAKILGAVLSNPKDYIPDWIKGRL